MKDNLENEIRNVTSLFLLLNNVSIHEPPGHHEIIAGVHLPEPITEYLTELHKFWLPFKVQFIIFLFVLRRLDFLIFPSNFELYLAEGAQQNLFNVSRFEEEETMDGKFNTNSPAQREVEDEQKGIFFEGQSSFRSREFAFNLLKKQKKNRVQGAR